VEEHMKDFIEASDSTARAESTGKPGMLQPTYAQPESRKTEHGQIEEAYRALVDHSLQGLVIFQDERAVFANRAMADISGYSVDEILSMSAGQIRDFVHPEDRELIWARHQKRLAGDSMPERYEMRGIRKDGGICWLEIHTSRIEYHGRSAVQAAYLDITKCRRAEQELEKAHQFLLTILSSFPASVVVLDGAGAIAMTNDSWATFGRANGPAPGSFEAGANYLDICRSATGPGSEGAWEMAEAIAAVLSGERDDFKVDYPCHDPGQKRWLHLQVHGFSYGDKRWAVLAHTDITERRRIEDRLLGYHERLRSLAAKLALARERERRRVGLGLHDQIGQRLVMIKLSLRALQETTDPETAEALARSCRGIDALTEQIRLLGFDLSNSVLHEVGFREAVEALLEREVQRKHGIACECQASGDFAGLDVEMKMALFCNLRELLASVLKYAGARRLHVQLKQDGGTITVAVEDDGESPEWKQLTSPGASGGDLGLFSIREQIEALGGSMHIRAGSEHGTRITIISPIRCRASLRS
jgi:PAS domain S-box-containing protein